MTLDKLNVACSRLRDGDGKSFSNTKSKKRAGAGERQAKLNAVFNTEKYKDPRGPAKWIFLYVPRSDMREARGGVFTFIHVAVPGKPGQIPTVLQRRASGNACRVAGLSFDATPQWHREPERCIS